MNKKNNDSVDNVVEPPRARRSPIAKEKTQMERESSI